MSHGYSIYFTTKDGKFMGQWAIQEHITRDKIEDIRKEDPNVFIGDFYELEDCYDVIEVDICHIYWYSGCIKEDVHYLNDIHQGVKHAVKNKLRMFLG